MAQRIASGFALEGTGKSQPRHFLFNGTKDWYWVCPGGYRQIPASPYFVSIQLLVSASLSGGFLFQFWKALRSTPKAKKGNPEISI